MAANTIHILFFGQLTEVTNTSNINISNVANTDEAIEKILAQFPSLKNYTYTVALDKKIISGKTIVNDNQTLAFMPPFSGG